MKIREIDTDKRVMVVAEIGNNHEGNFEVAKEMVWQAARCKVDAVKFQTFRTEYFVSAADRDRYARLESFKLTDSQFGELARVSHEAGLLFISTPLDLGSARMLEPLVDAYKIASGDNNFYPLLALVAATSKPMIVSMGLADEAQVQEAVDFVTTRRRSAGELAILHCVASYPVPLEQANLRSIPYLAEKFPEVTVGYSDHTQGITAALAAVALGARIIEKHFTLDHNYSDFHDHQLSADPGEMKELVRRALEIGAMLGDYDKRIQVSEKDMIAVARRSVVAVRDLPKDHTISADDITWVRPAGGLTPGEEDVLIGNILTRAVKAGEQLQEDDVDRKKKKLV